MSRDRLRTWNHHWWTATLCLGAILAGHNLIWHGDALEIATAPAPIRLVRDILFLLALALSVAWLWRQRRRQDLLPPTIPLIALAAALAIPLFHCLDRDAMTEINQGLRVPWLYAACVGAMGAIWDSPRRGERWIAAGAAFLTISLVCCYFWPALFYPEGRFAGTLHTGNYAGAAILVSFLWSTALFDRVSPWLLAWWTTVAVACIILSASLGAVLLLPAALAWAVWRLTRHAQARLILLMGLTACGVAILALCLLTRPLLVNKLRFSHALMSQDAGNPDNDMAMASLPRSIDWTSPAAVQQERHRLHHTVSSLGLRLMDAQQLLALASGRGYLTDTGWFLGQPGGQRQRFDSQWLTSMHNDGLIGLLVTAVFWGWFLVLAVRLALVPAVNGKGPYDGEPLALAFSMACILVLFAAYPLQLRYPNNLLTAVIAARILWLHRQRPWTIAHREESPA